MSEVSSEQNPPRPLANAVESGYLPALMTAFAALLPAMMGGEQASGDLRSGLVIYALPMSLVASKAFAVTLTPLRDWWTRALAADKLPWIPFLMMAWMLQAWTLMAACVTVIVSRGATQVLASSGVSGQTLTHLRGDVALWLTSAPVLVLLVLSLAGLVFCRSLWRASQRRG